MGVLSAYVHMPDVSDSLGLEFLMDVGPVQMLGI